MQAVDNIITRKNQPESLVYQMLDLARLLRWISMIRQQCWQRLLLEQLHGLGGLDSDGIVAFDLLRGGVLCQSYRQGITISPEH